MSTVIEVMQIMYPGHLCMNLSHLAHRREITLELEPFTGTLMKDQGLPLAEDYSFKGFPVSLGDLAKGEDMILEG